MAGATEPFQGYTYCLATLPWGHPSPATCTTRLGWPHPDREQVCSSRPLPQTLPQLCRMVSLHLRIPCSTLLSPAWDQDVPPQFWAVCTLRPPWRGWGCAVVVWTPAEHR